MHFKFVHKETWKKGKWKILLKKKVFMIVWGGKVDLKQISSWLTDMALNKINMTSSWRQSRLNTKDKTKSDIWL